jgi:hypothetical protein
MRCNPLAAPNSLASNSLPKLWLRNAGPCRLRSRAVSARGGFAQNLPCATRFGGILPVVVQFAQGIGSVNGNPKPVPPRGGVRARRQSLSLKLRFGGAWRICRWCCRGTD